MLQHYSNVAVLSQYKDCFKGKNAVVVASGPTLFDYRDLSDFSCPVFLVNDAVRFEKYVNESFLVTHHPPYPACGLVSKSLYLCPLVYFRNPDKFLDFERAWSETVWLKSIKDIKPEVKRLYYVPTFGSTPDDWYKNKSMDIKKFPNWCLDKNEIIKQKSLFAHTGSITTLIHFMWFCGIQKATMIGCCPQYYKHHCHDERISKQSGRVGSSFDLEAIITNQLVFLEYFNIEADYLGDFDYSDYSTHENPKSARPKVHRVSNANVYK